MSKVDLKDGYWRLCVNATNAWNFAYVLPKLDKNEEIMLVIPDALQMGWSESPAFFCAVTETVRDVADKNFAAKKKQRCHKMEDIMMDLDVNAKRFLPTLTDDTEGIFQHLLEVYINDFIGLIQAADKDTVRRFSQCIPHAIYNAFPPLTITGSDMGPAVSRTKLEKEGKWETRKEILGWLINDIRRTIELPPNKCETLCSEITLAIDYARNSPK